MSLTVRLFQASVESILLYGCEDLVPHQSDDKIPHMNAMDIAECQLERTHDYPGQPAKTLLTTLIEDSEVKSRDELATLLADREVWHVRHRACLKF